MTTVADTGMERKGKLIFTGQRVTPQRALLLELINEAGGHIDADELYRRARAKKPRLSLSTVYRALRLFKDMGLVEERHFDEEHHHYELKPTSEHYHFFCLGCGRVIEFESSLSQQLKDDVAREKDLEILGAEFHLSGYCAACRERR